MTLFSTTIQVYEVLLVFYVGLISGIIFNFLLYFTTYVNNKIKNKQACNKNKTQKTKKTFKHKFKVFYLNFISFCTNLALLFTFICILSTSYFINFTYNMGHFSLFHIPLWCIAFFLGKRFVKIVAKFLFCFYNILKKGFKKQ